MDFFRRAHALIISLYRQWVALGRVFGRVIGVIVFALFYIVVIGAYALVVRLFSLVRPKRASSNAVWRRKPYRKPTHEELRRLF